MGKFIEKSKKDTALELKNRYRGYISKNNDKNAAMILILAICDFCNIAGHEPRPVKGWEGELCYILKQMRVAKILDDAQKRKEK
jgi:hypothetical protein